MMTNTSVALVRPRRRVPRHARSTAISMAFAVCICCLGSDTAVHANPWAPVANPVDPVPDIYVPTPQQVPGKDFSHHRDRDENGLPLTEQVVSWDGSGGVRNSFNYAGSRPLYPIDTEVDAISNGGDALFTSLKNDQAALLFSVTGDPRIHYVNATGFPNSTPGFGVWAEATDIDAMNPPLDVDGLEVWGPDDFNDTNRYSLNGDPATQDPAGGGQKVSIWEYDSFNHLSIPHTYTWDLAAAIDLQFTGVGEGGPIWSHLVEIMDLDAMLTLGEQVIFSIEPIDLSQFDPALPNFNGGEIFVYEGAGTATSFLVHGGYTWDSSLDLVATFGVPSQNINALEAVSMVPEPSSMVLFGFGLVAAGVMARRRQIRRRGVTA